MADMQFDPAGWFSNLAGGINEGLSWLDDNVFAPIGDFFGDVGGYINNAITGERDLQRQKDAEERAVAYEKELTDYKNDINIANYRMELADAKKAAQYYADDLRAAGFNPALVATRGGSTAIPSIGSANSASGISTKGTPYGNPAALSQILKVAESAVNVAGMLLMK